MGDTDHSLQARLAEGLGGDYTIEEEVGRGGMGVVFSARDEKLKRRVAIKALPPELAFREDIRTRFLREAETAARLSHPHIVPIYAVGESAGVVYFVMAFVDGESLGAKIRRRHKLPPEEVRRVMKETADALSGAHSLEIIHRDVKPDNILLEGTRGRVMVTDFGIAKALTEGSSGLTGTGVAIGTPAFMSPEQAAGEKEIDHRSDVYSLGVVAYQALTGELPFKAPTVPKLLLKQITEPAPDVSTVRPDCPEDLAAAIQRCLEKEPEDRWGTADALRRALEHRTATPYKAKAPPRRPSSSRTRPPQLAKKRDNLLEKGWDGSWEDSWGTWKPRRRVPARGRAAAGDASAKLPTKGESDVVRRFRNTFASWASVCGGLMLLDLATPGGPWFQWVALPWAAFGLVPNYAKLWEKGYSWRDIIRRPPAPDAVEAQRARAQALPEQLPATRDEFGAYASKIQRARNDKDAVLKMYDRLSKTEREMLPDIVPTFESLLSRATELAHTLHDMGGVDERQLADLHGRIAQLDQDDSGPDRVRRRDLLERQRGSLQELLSRRAQVEAQLESCLLAMQNMRFDLLRLKSAGVNAVLDDLTMATQQARALAVDVDNAISAAKEIRETLRR